MDRFRLLFGFGLIVMILGSGVLMSLYILKEESQTIHPDDWHELEARVASLAEMHDTSTPIRTTVTKTISPSEEMRHDLVPINSADQKLLETLDGIGPARAIAILAARDNGPFRDLDDLEARVSKLPTSVLDDISSKITFE